ncbi:hypothetical protein F4824DRAFT_179390 [Ustulina deusta]|nr:hypothetical protein F4824DRAFT_179390 [Ustulina deusta]
MLYPPYTPQTLTWFFFSSFPALVSGLWHRLNVCCSYSPCVSAVQRRWAILFFLVRGYYLSVMALIRGDYKQTYEGHMILIGHSDALFLRQRGRAKIEINLR